MSSLFSKYLAKENKALRRAKLSHSTHPAPPCELACRVRSLSDPTRDQPVKWGGRGWGVAWRSGRAAGQRGGTTVTRVLVGNERHQEVLDGQKRKGVGERLLEQRISEGRLGGKACKSRFRTARMEPRLFVVGSRSQRSAGSRPSGQLYTRIVCSSSESKGWRVPFGRLLVPSAGPGLRTGIEPTEPTLQTFFRGASNTAFEARNLRGGERQSRRARSPPG